MVSPEYLLDTNVISALMKQPQGPLAARISALEPNVVATSIIVACELRYGARRKDSRRLTDQLEKILQSIDVLPLEETVDHHYAEIRTSLEQSGKVIGANDMLIAAHALALDATLITGNLREFERVPTLRVENWMAS